MPRPVNAGHRQEQQEQFLAALGETGIISKASAQSGVPVTTHYWWLRTDPEYPPRLEAVKAAAEQAGLAVVHQKPHASGYRQGGQRGEKRRENQERFLEALRRTGIAADAAKEIGIAKATYNQWMRVDPEFAVRAREIFAATGQQRTEGMAERLSRAGQASWADPERRAEWARRQREEFWTPERRADWSERTTEIARSPEGRASRSAGGKRVWRDPESRRRRSEEMRQRWADPEYKARMAENLTKPEVREARSRGARARWAAMSPEERDRLRVSMSHGRRTIKGGHRISKLEAATMTALNDRDLPYFVHKHVGGYFADLLVPSLSLVIECDGAYYHDLRRDTDAVRDAAMLALGYETLRLPEAEIKAKDWTRLDETITRLSRTSA